MKSEGIKQPTGHVLLHMAQAEEVMKAWFSGQVPEAGAHYVLRCNKAEAVEGIIAAEFSFVKVVL